MTADAGSHGQSWRKVPDSGGAIFEYALYVDLLRERARRDRPDQDEREAAWEKHEFEVGRPVVAGDIKHSRELQSEAKMGFRAGWDACVAGRSQAIDEANAFGYREGHQAALASSAKRVENLEKTMRGASDELAIEALGDHEVSVGTVMKIVATLDALLSSEGVERG